MSDKDEDIILEAKKRFKRCVDFEADFRDLFLADLKFANGDSDNQYQWPQELTQSRDLDQRPSLTINKTRQHVLMIQNEIKENRPAVKITATGGDATYDSAQVFEGLVRYIEQNSSAADAYDAAMQFQVQCGIGYWRVTTDYAGDDSFDQEIYIKRILDPMSVYLDPDCVSGDGSDARFGFIFDEMPIEEYRRKYPREDENPATLALDETYGWHKEDHIRVAEYFRCVYEKDWLLAMPITDAQGQETGQFDTMKLSDIPSQLRDHVRADKSIRRRPIETKKWEWYQIAGCDIIDRKVWPSKYIPIVRVVGEELLIEGRLERKGHVRNIKDPQRMYNYWTSSAVEQVALQGKQPYMADIRAISGYENMYANANRINYPYLPYRSFDEQGAPIAAPTREAPPQMAQAYIQGLQISAEEMKMVSGQSDPTMGAQANEIAGVAIAKRIKQGDKATFHFIDNMCKAVAYTGKIIVDLIPHIYDTPRVIRILGEDGTDEQIKIDPAQQQALSTTSEDKQESEASRIFNPGVGKYDVVSQAGPSYASKREEAAESMTALALQSPDFMINYGDIFFKTMDFPGADELSERARRAIPPNLLGEGPSPAEQQLQGQLQQVTAQLQTAMEALADQSRDLDIKAAKNQTDDYKAITDRLDKLLAHMVSIDALPSMALVQAQTASDALQSGQEIGQDQQPASQPQGMAQMLGMTQDNGQPPAQAPGGVDPTQMGIPPAQ